MSKPKHARERIDNSLTDLMIGVKLAVTGGSSLSSYGTIDFANNYALITQNRIVLTYLMASNGLFQTAVQLPIQDALSKRIEIESGEMEPENIDEIMDWIEDHEGWQRLEDFWTWVRVYGGGALIANTDQDPEQPLSMRRLKGAPIEFYDIDRWQISVASMTQNDFLEYEDMTNSDSLSVNGQPVHRSRMIIGLGKKAPSYIRRQLRGWGMSEAERMLRDLNNYLKTGDVLYEILDEAKIDVYKIEGLANKMLTAGGTEAIKNRIIAANQIKSYVNALVLDMKEEFEQKTMTFAGLAEVMRENRIGVASALRMPLTKLFGISAAGFSSGEEDTDNYHEMIESEIRSKMRPAIRRMIEFACANLWGYVPTFRFKFPPLKVLPEVDAAQVHESKANIMLALYDRGLITDGTAIGDELAKSEVISAELAAKFQLKPMPPNGGNDVQPMDTNKVGVFKKAKDAASDIAQNVAKRISGGK
jgi:phage-related protein (TIGR01555 family)